ncbi:hypothetical protein [Helicobacter suis]|uniref:hypothetical protein n=1 Tax=Helicobacter suis TaxID=104628 RepID=UPI0013CFA969|nr:hypothetical protein [Helicobacter suis]
MASKNVVKQTENLKQEIEVTTIHVGALEFGSDNAVWISFKNANSTIGIKLDNFKEWFLKTPTKGKLLRGRSEAFKKDNEPVERILVAVEGFSAKTFKFYVAKSAEPLKTALRGVKPIEFTLTSQQIEKLKTICSLWGEFSTDSESMRKYCSMSTTEVAKTLEDFNPDN